MAQQQEQPVQCQGMGRGVPQTFPTQGQPDPEVFASLGVPLLGYRLSQAKECAQSMLWS